MPQFHSRAMRQNIMQMFGHVTGVKPAYLREIYRQLAGDATATSSESEKDIDVRVRQLLSLKMQKWWLT